MQVGVQGWLPSSGGKGSGHDLHYFRAQEGAMRTEEQQPDSFVISKKLRQNIHMNFNSLMSFK